MNDILLYVKSIITEFIPFIPYIIVFRIFFILLVYIKRYKLNLLHEICLWIFIFFCFGLISQTISFDFIFYKDFSIKGGQNFIPFKGISQILNSSRISHKVINILGNIMMFVPIGLLPPMLWKPFKKLWKSVGLGFCFSLFIETIQLFSIRSTDIDDLILNTLGAFIGYIIYLILKLLFKNFINNITISKIKKA